MAGRSVSDLPRRVSFELLGPLRVTLDGVPAALGGPRSRAVLAMLLTTGGAAVSEDALIESLWGQQPPKAARNSLQSHVSRLRSALACIGGETLGARLVREPAGYRLEVAPDEIDAARVEELLRRASVPGTDARQRLQLLESARQCFRGPALTELANLPGWTTAGLAAAATRYDELEATVDEEVVSARLATGGHAGVLPELEQIAGRRPERERLQRLLALALYRCGRPADALAVLRRYREGLVEAAGLDPSPSLQRLEQGILTGDAEITDGPGAGGWPSSPSAPAAPGDAPNDSAPAVRIVSAAPFIGRRDELERLAHALSESRLVTVVGPGGVGKTRLALELARRLTAGTNPEASAVVIELGTLTHDEDVVASLAARLGVRDGPGRSLEDAVVDYLATTQILLVMDNCEHLLKAAGDLVRRIMLAAPGVQVMVTSRRRLGLEGEQMFRLLPLPVPDDGDQVGDETDSVRLFLDRARRLDPMFDLNATTRPVVAELCRRLDGLPLAIELATGQLGALGLADLRDHLDDRLDLLADTTPTARPPSSRERHRTLRAMVEWSYDQLSETEQGVFDSLAVFEGGFSLAAATFVAGPPDAPAGGPLAINLVARLVESSLVSARDDGDARLRYSLLETIRTYALERLRRRGDEPAVRRRHVAWVVTLVEDLEPRLDGPEEQRYVAILESELANVRAAWRTAVEDGDLHAAARISVALASYAHWHGNAELWRRARMLADSGDVSGPIGSAVQGAAAQAAYLQGDLQAAEQYARGVTTDAWQARARPWWATVTDHVLAMYRGDFLQAERLAAAARKAPDTSATWQVVLAGNVGLARLYAGDVDGAASALTACRNLITGESSVTARAWAAYVAGETLGVTDPRDALEQLGRSVALAETVGATFVSGVATVAQAAVATRVGETTLALQRFPEAVRHWQRAGMWVQQWTTLRNLALLLADLGAHGPAAVLLAASEDPPDASAVTGEDRQRIDSLWDRLLAGLGQQEIDRHRATASAMTRTDAVASALTALDDARARTVRAP